MTDIQLNVYFKDPFVGRGKVCLFLAGLYTKMYSLCKKNAEVDYLK
jgi:hypothetical protein